MTSSASSTTELTAENLAKYLTINDLQLPNTFTTFGSGAFANTTVNQITFGTAEKPIAYTTTGSTNSSDELAAIMKLLKAASQDADASLDSTNVLQG